MPLLMEGNRAKTAAAPVIALLGMDMAFYENCRRLSRTPMPKPGFVGNDALIAATTSATSNLRERLLACSPPARCGLDCGPDVRLRCRQGRCRILRPREIKANFICSLGCGDPAHCSTQPAPASPRSARSCEVGAGGTAQPARANMGRLSRTRSMGRRFAAG